MMYRSLVVFALLFFAVPFVYAQPANPPAEGFNAADSDARAMEIADAVMERLGGRENWDNTRYLSWTFFQDDQVWDKFTGDFRYQKEDLVVLMNVHTQEGRAWQGGEEVTDEAEREEHRKAAYRAWVNSGYWLLMPYKLKDSGVTLTYLGEGETEEGEPAEMLQLAFEEVGLTPQNKYHVYVNKETMLVDQWAYFPDAGDTEPRFVRPWKNWQQYGNIMLSDNRGEMQNGGTFELPNIGVYETLPRSVFTDPAPIDLSTLGNE